MTMANESEGAAQAPADENRLVNKRACDAAMVLYAWFLNALEDRDRRNPFVRAVDYVAEAHGLSGVREMALSMGEAIEGAWMSLPCDDRLVLAWPIFVTLMAHNFDWSDCVETLRTPTASPEIVNGWARQMCDNWKREIAGANRPEPGP